MTDSLAIGDQILEQCAILIADNHRVASRAPLDWVKWLSPLVDARSGSRLAHAFYIVARHSGHAWRPPYPEPIGFC